MAKINNNKTAFTLGEEIFGPLILSFCSFIHDIVLKNKLEHLIFFSRDMRLVMDSYKILYGNHIQSFYFHVSRKSLEAVEECSDQKKAFLSYMKQAGFFLHCGFVDIGWQGQIQFKLERIIKDSEIKTELPFGIYFGKFNTLESLCGKEHVVSFLNSGKVLPVKFQTLNRSIEAFFSAQENKTVGYRSDSSPIFEVDSRYTEGIKSFQQGALAYIKKVKQENVVYTSKKYVETSVTNFLRFLIYPTLEEISFFEKDSFEDGKTIKMFERKENFNEFFRNITNITWKGAYFRVNNKSFLLYRLYMFVGGIRLRYINTRKIRKIKNAI